MLFIKEIDATIKDEFAFIYRQIESLLPSSVKINAQILTVRHCLVKTMAERKVCNTFSSNKAA